MTDFRILVQIIILVLFARLLHQHLKHSSSIGELAALAMFFMLFIIAGTFEELWVWVGGLI